MVLRMRTSRIHALCLGALIAGGCVADDETVGEASHELSAMDHGRDIWFNNTYGGEKFFTFLANHPDPAKRITIGFKNVVETPREFVVLVAPHHSCGAYLPGPEWRLFLPQPVRPVRLRDVGVHAACSGQP